MCLAGRPRKISTAKVSAGGNAKSSMMNKSTRHATNHVKFLLSDEASKRGHRKKSLPKKPFVTSETHNGLELILEAATNIKRQSVERIVDYCLELFVVAAAVLAIGPSQLQYFSRQDFTLRIDVSSIVRGGCK